jgi:hypothetical protein
MDAEEPLYSGAAFKHLTDRDLAYVLLAVKHLRQYHVQFSH